MTMIPYWRQNISEDDINAVFEHFGAVGLI